MDVGCLYKSLRLSLNLVSTSLNSEKSLLGNSNTVLLVLRLGHLSYNFKVFVQDDGVISAGISGI